MLLVHLVTLEHDVGIKGLCLARVASYLRDRRQTVIVPGGKSSSCPLLSGVPQGSVLGPVLFTIYTKPLADILRLHGISYRLYTDNTQPFVEFKLTDNLAQEEAIRRIELCVTSIRAWMEKSMLKLNDGKTELHIYPKSVDATTLPCQSWICPHPAVSSCQKPVCSIDSVMALDEHVQNICWAAYYHRHSISRICCHLDVQSRKHSIIHASVISHLDGCNSLHGLPTGPLQCLQTARNACVRTIMGRGKYECITPVLRDLHWLPIASHICFKTLVLTYKCLHRFASQYLSDLLTEYRPARTLQSAGQLLVQPKARTKVGERAFSFTAPRLWNELPPAVHHSATLKQFRVTLKLTFSGTIVVDWAVYTWTGFVHRTLLCITNQLLL